MTATSTNYIYIYLFTSYYVDRYILGTNRQFSIIIETNNGSILFFIILFKIWQGQKNEDKKQ